MSGGQTHGPYPQPDGQRQLASYAASRQAPQQPSYFSPDGEAAAAAPPMHHGPQASASMPLLMPHPRSQPGGLGPYAASARPMSPRTALTYAYETPLMHFFEPEGRPHQPHSQQQPSGQRNSQQQSGRAMAANALPECFAGMEDSWSGTDNGSTASDTLLLLQSRERAMLEAELEEGMTSRPYEGELVFVRQSACY